MSAKNCTSCGAELSAQGRFCGACGAPSQASAVNVDAQSVDQVSVDPLGRRPKASVDVPSAPAKATATLDALGIPSGRRGGAGPSPSSNTRGDMDWLEGAAIAGVALLPAVLFGAAFAVFAAFAGPLRDVGVNLMSAIGLVSALAYGGGLSIDAGVNVGIAAAQGGLFLSDFMITVTCMSGLLLFAGSRRALRHAELGNSASYLRAVTPSVVFFIGGAMALSALLGVGGLSGLEESLSISASLMRTFFISALIAAVAAGVALSSRARFTIPILGSAWRRLSAPVFGIAVLLLLVGIVALVASTLAVLYSTWLGWDTLGLLILLASFALDVILAVVSLGVFSTVGFSIDASAIDVLQRLNTSSSSDMRNTSWGVLSGSGSSLWLGIALVVVVSLAGIAAAAGMILRRRDADAARQDFATWIVGFFVLAAMVLLFSTTSMYVSAQATSIAGGGEAAGGASVGVSPSVLVLLPLFAAGWWLLARLLLPRIPAATLTRLSSWARSGL